MPVPLFSGAREKQPVFTLVENFFRSERSGPCDLFGSHFVFQCFQGFFCFGLYLCRTIEEDISRDFAIRIVWGVCIKGPESIQGFGQALSGGTAEPVNGLLQVTGSPFSCQAGKSQAVLGLGIPGVCRFPEPLYGGQVVLEDAFPVVIGHAKIVLGFGIPLVGGFFPPIDSLLVILMNSFSGVIGCSQIVLGIRQIVFRRFSEPVNRQLVALRDTFAAGIEQSQIILGSRFSLFRRS